MYEQGDNHRTNPVSGFELRDDDRAAVDAHFGDDGAGADGQRARRVEALLGLIGTPVAEESGRETRIDVATLSALNPPSEPRLTRASRESVDEWIDGREPVAPRDERHAALADAVRHGAPSDAASREALIERTLAAIQSDIDQSEKRHIMDTPITPGGGVRLADIVSVAAMLLLIASVAIPVMGGIRARQFQAECQSHLADVTRSFGLYAGSNADTLPMATAGFSGGTWMDVGSTPDRSNSSNLFVVVRQGYADLEDLACPTNPDALTDAPVERMHDWRSLDEISYSYRIMRRGGLKLHEIANPSGVVVLADRSPVVRRIARQEPVRPEENTPNHDGRGQHALRLDGATQWTTSPVLEQGDNLWLPRHIERAIYEVRDRLGIIEGNEMPSGPTDAFVAP